MRLWGLLLAWCAPLLALLYVGALPYLPQALRLGLYDRHPGAFMWITVLGCLLIGWAANRDRFKADDDPTQAQDLGGRRDPKP